jgi:hypothetical protein
LLTLPVASQSGAGNGALACSGLLLAYHGASLDAEAEVRFPAERLADVTLVELRDYLRGRGFAAEVVHATQPKVEDLLEHGYPVLLALEGRFVLAFGLRGSRLGVEDSGTGAREVDVSRVEGRFMLVAVPRRLVLSDLPGASRARR